MAAAILQGVPATTLDPHIRIGRLNKRRLIQPFRAGGTESEAA